MKKIDFAIIGVQKAATTSLAYYLSQHPKICTHKSEELPYFTLDEQYQIKYKTIYQKNFSHCKNKKILAKSVTIIQNEKAIERLYQHNKNMKIVVVLRNPIDRAYSAYWYAKRMGWEEDISFEEALNREDKREEKSFIVKRITQYMKNGEYANQLEILYKYFPREQVFILLQEDLQKDSLSVCSKIFNFFSLNNYSKIDLSRINESAMPKVMIISKVLHMEHPFKRYIKNKLPIFIQIFIDRLREKVIKVNEKKFQSEKMTKATRERLVLYFKDKNKNLENIINRDLSHWNK